MKAKDNINKITKFCFSQVEAVDAREELLLIWDEVENVLPEATLDIISRMMLRVVERIRDLDDEIDDLEDDKIEEEYQAEQWQATAEEAQDRLKEQLTDALNRPKFVHLTDDLRGLEARSEGDDRELIARALEILEGIEQEVLA